MLGMIKYYIFLYAFEAAFI